MPQQITQSSPVTFWIRKGKKKKKWIMFSCVLPPHHQTPSEIIVNIRHSENLRYLNNL